MRFNCSWKVFRQILGMLFLGRSSSRPLCIAPSATIAGIEHLSKRGGDNMLNSILCQISKIGTWALMSKQADRITILHALRNAAKVIEETLDKIDAA